LIDTIPRSKAFWLESGGIRPTERHRSKNGRWTCSSAKRSHRGVVAGKSMRAIAGDAGPPPSTDGREIDAMMAGEAIEQQADQAAWIEPVARSSVNWSDRALAHLVDYKLRLDGRLSKLPAG
jgi:hypothetical protein